MRNRNTVAVAGSSRHMKALAPKSVKAGLSGHHILIVEDEMLIAFTLSDMVTALGCTWEMASRFGKAMSLATGHLFDAAILDMNLAGEAGYPIADALAARGIPFVIATGYGPEGIEAPYRHRPMLLKPYFPHQVEAVLMKALALR